MKNQITSHARNLKNTLFFLLTIFSFPIFLYGGEPIRVMPLGDSITYGNNYYNAPDLATQVAYRKHLWEDLSTAGYTIDFIGWQEGGTDFNPPFDSDHQGHPGYTTVEIAGEVYNYLDVNEPEVVLLHIGTNELRTDTADVELALNEIDRYENDKNVHIQVILARIINRWVGWDDPDNTNRTTPQHFTDTTTFNTNLQTIANARITAGDDIIVVDMETDSGINYDATDMTDDLHPNDSGYAKMANIWFKALQTTLPTHLWKFDEPTNATTFVDTYRDNNGICIGNCPETTTGMIGGAELFDGSDEVTVADDDTFDWSGSDSFTIEFWVKPTRTDGVNQVVVGRENEAKDNYYWWAGIVGSDGHITFRLLDSGGTSINLDGPVLNANEWYHVACVRDGANNQNLLYVNGAAVSSPAAYAGNFVGTTPVNIGYLAFQGSNSLHLDSVLDELTIYNGAMNAAQAKLHYERGIEGSVQAITSTPTTLANVGSAYLYNVDSTMDPLSTFDYTAFPDLGWMNIAPDTGVISGTVTDEFVGNVNMSVVATSAPQTVTQDYVLKVRNPASLPDGMSHYWKLDEVETTNTRTYIDSYAGADGICTGNDCPTPRLGRVDGAQSFNGSNSIDVTDTGSFDWAADASFTIEYWIRVDSGTDISKNMVVIGRDSSSSAFTWWAGIINSTGHAFFFLRDNNGGASTVNSSSSTVGDNTAGHHVAIVRDGGAGETKLYLDGNMESTTTYTYTGDFTDSNAPAVNIGYLNFNDIPNYFLNNGTSGIDDLAIFNIAMTSTQVQAHYQNSLEGKSFEDLPAQAPDSYTRANDIVTDHNRGIQWEDTPYTAADENAYNSQTIESERARQWIHAEDHCTNLNLDGGGWRLPSYDELDSIIDKSRVNPAINPIFQNALGLGTWSGTTYPENTAQAWGVGFYSGDWHHCTKDNYSKLIRCVRDGIVTPPANQTPTAKAGPDQTVTENSTITLDGSASSDSDGMIMSYEWREGGTVLSTAVSFDKSDFSVGTHTITLTVTDNEGASGSDSVTVTVTATTPPPTNTPPVAYAGADKSVELGQTVTVVGSGTDTDGTIASYEWKKGTTVVATTASFNYTPTAVGIDTLTLTVMDDDGATASDIMNVLVTDASTPPPSGGDFSSDDFSSNTLADYTTSGSGSWTYDSANERASVTTSGTTGFSFSRSFASPATEGTFSFDVNPVQKNDATGLIELRLEESANTYYRIVNRDGSITGGITKYVNGTRVDAKWFRTNYVQGGNYTVSVTFSPGSTTVNAFGQTLTISTNQTSINVSSFTLRTENQDANFDNINYN